MLDVRRPGGAQVDVVAVPVLIGGVCLSAAQRLYASRLHGFDAGAVADLLRRLVGPGAAVGAVQLRDLHRQFAVGGVVLAAHHDQAAVLGQARRAVVPPQIADELLYRAHLSIVRLDDGRGGCAALTALPIRRRGMLLRLRR